MAKKKKKPIFEDKENNIKIQVWRNTSKSGKPFVLVRVWAYRFPFKFHQKIDMGTGELQSLGKLIERMPKFEIKEKKK